MCETRSVRRDDFLSENELRELGKRCTLLDPSSTLISRRAIVGRGNLFYPGVVFECDGTSEMSIGDSNRFFPGSFVLAADHAQVTLGSQGSYGPGGVQIKANRPGTLLSIGDHVRLSNGPEIVGASLLGDGAQVIGAIQAQSVRLAGGGDHNEADPDRRAAVLKGVGLARGIVLGIGEVVNGIGDFAASPVQRQASYHPRA